MSSDINPPQAESPLELVICPECDAAVGASARFCWLCGHQMSSPFKGRTAAPFAASPAAVRPAMDPTQELLLNVSLAGLAVMLIMITAAVWALEPSYGIGLAVVIGPALLITLVSGLVSRLSGKPHSPGRRLLVFVKSTVAMFAVAAATAALAVFVAAIMIIGLMIALLQTCLKMLGGG